MVAHAWTGVAIRATYSHGDKGPHVRFSFTLPDGSSIAWGAYGAHHAAWRDFLDGRLRPLLRRRLVLALAGENQTKANLDANAILVQVWESTRIKGPQAWPGQSKSLAEALVMFGPVKDPDLAVI